MKLSKTWLFKMILSGRVIYLFIYLYIYLVIYLELGLSFMQTQMLKLQNIIIS